MEHIKSFRISNGGNTSFFDCHHQFLPENHPYRKQRDKFKKGVIVKDLPPPGLSGQELFARVFVLLVNEFGTRVGNQKLDGFGLQHNWVKKSIFLGTTLLENKFDTS